MGCLLGKQDINDIHPDIFSVHNIDHEGRCTTTGNIKITNNTLELIRAGVPTMIWPLKSLRQYGHDDDIFTFESGRRGPQGPGVYSFRCSRAKQLFELVQTNVHRNQEEQSSRRISLGTIIDPTTPGQEVPPVSPPAAPTTAPPIFEPVTPSITSLPPTSPPASAGQGPGGATTDLTNPEYMNVEPRLQPPVSSISQHIPITSPTTPTSMEPNMSLSQYERLAQTTGDQYENVTIPTTKIPPKIQEKTRKNSSNLPPMPVRNQAEVSYATLELNPIENPTHDHQSGETNNNHETINEASGSGTGTNPGGSGVTSTNFGTISSTSTNLVHQSTEESNGGSYAMIDLDKTHAIAALNAGQSNPTDEGIRRTRHNSTLEGISSFSTNGKIIG